MRRRQFLTGVTGAAVGSALGGRSLARPATARPTTALQPVGRHATDGLKDAVVGPDGETGYVAASDGYVVYDVTDPANPAPIAERRGLLADRENGPMQEVYDLAVDGDQLVVVGPAHEHSGDVLRAAVFVDVSDPTDPERLAVHETDFAIHNCAFADGIAYLTRNTDRTELVAVEAGANPSRTGTWSIENEDERWADVAIQLRTLHDVTIHDDRAYLAHWDAGTWVVDVADPSDLTTVTQIGGQPVENLVDLDYADTNIQATQMPGNHHHARVTDDGSVLGINVEAWDEPADEETQGGPGGIELWDVSDLADPEHLTTIDPPETPDPTRDGVWTTSHDFTFDGDRLYSSWYRGGVRVFDIADPTAPTELASWQDRETTEFWTAVPLDTGFIAPSRRDPSEGSSGAALYVFPDPPGDGTPQTPSNSSETATKSANSDDESENVSETTAGEGPGFGVVAALAGLGLGAWRLQRNDP